MRLRLYTLALLPAIAACSDLRDSVVPTVPTTPSRAVSSAPPRYIVMFRDEVKGARDVATAMTAAHGTSADFVYTASIKGFAARLSPQAVDALKHDPRVLMVEPEKIVTLDGIESPTPSWGLDRIDQRDLPLDNSYTYPRTGIGVHFYGIDSGILPTHTDFTGRIEPGFTAIADGYGTTDCFGHGTHTASTAAGATYGVAKGMTLVPVRVFDCSGAGGSAEIVAGVDWVTAHAVRPAVANMSLGILGGDEPTDSAVSKSIQAGIVYAVAAGNRNADACFMSPAKLTAAITVGASVTVNAGDYRASFSDYGDCLDLFAPGVGITAAWIGSNTATRTEDGTSMASPHVAGVAGMYLETQPNATPAQVASAITGNATLGRMSFIPGEVSPNVLLYAGFMPANVPPTAAFTWSCTAKQACTFDATTSTDPDGTIVSYVWTIDKVKQPVSGAVVTVSLKGNRARQVVLTVTDNTGATSTATKTIQP